MEESRLAKAVLNYSPRRKIERENDPGEVGETYDAETCNNARPTQRRRRRRRK